MKTTPRSVSGGMKVMIRQLSVTITVLVTGGTLSAAEPPDPKTFEADESYLVENVPIVLTQRPGEATIKVGPAFGQDDSRTLSAANGANFVRERELADRSGIYRCSPPISDAASKEAVDSLNLNSDVEYAYPVYVNPATGKRHFINDEIVVRLNAPWIQARPTS
jgi:hypothetical protein